MMLLGAAFGSSGRSSPLEAGQALEVIDQVGHADLDPGAGDPDGADDKAHSVLLPGKNMFNGRPDF